MRPRHSTQPAGPSALSPSGAGARGLPCACRPRRCVCVRACARVCGSVEAWDWCGGVCESVGLLWCV